MIVILILALCAYLFLSFAPTFGGQPDAQSQQKIEASKHFNGEHALVTSLTTNGTIAKFACRKYDTNSSCGTCPKNLIL